MVINPSVEVYLLDPKGYILAYSAPDSVIKRSSVSLDPIAAFLQHGGSSFVKGDDPRSINGQKAFSVARIEHDGTLEGYLYVILGGTEYDSVSQLLFGSYFLQLGIRTMILTLVAAAVIGLVVFRLITGSLRSHRQNGEAVPRWGSWARIPASASLEVQSSRQRLTKWQIRSTSHLRK